MKRVCALLIALWLAVLTATPVFAQEYYRVGDAAGLLTDTQFAELSAYADEISERYACDVVIVTLEEMEGSDAYEFARTFYEAYGVGYGDEKSGALLLLATELRDYALIVHGYGNTAFTRYGQDRLLDDTILPLLAEERYYDAFSAYLEKAEEYLAMARDGKPFDTYTDPEQGAANRRNALFWILAVSMIVAFIPCLILKYHMKSARPQRAADAYIAEGGVRLTYANDVFQYATQTRRRISSSSGGSRSGGGYSGSSGKY